MKLSHIKVLFLVISLSISYSSLNAQDDDSYSLLNYLRGMINENNEIEFANVSSLQSLITENRETGKFETVNENIPYTFRLSEKILSSTTVKAENSIYPIPFTMLVYNDEGEVVDKIPGSISFQKDGSDWNIVNITDKNDSNWKNVDGNWTIAP